MHTIEDLVTQINSQIADQRLEQLEPTKYEHLLHLGTEEVGVSIQRMRDRQRTGIDIIALTVHYDHTAMLGNVFKMQVRSADEADKNQLLGYGYAQTRGSGPTADSVKFWYYDVPTNKPVTITLQPVYG